MTLRLAGLLATLAAVAVLLTSLLLGLRTPAGGLAVETGLSPVARRAPAGEVIRVEVLNGAGIPNLARDVTEQLREQGFDVVFYGNAGRLARESSTVLDRAGDPVSAARVAAALGIQRIETVVDTTLYLEATVILAGDWAGIGQ